MSQFPFCEMRSTWWNLESISAHSAETPHAEQLNYFMVPLDYTDMEYESADQIKISAVIWLAWEYPTIPKYLGLQ